MVPTPRASFEEYSADDANWLQGYLATSRAKENTEGGIKNGRRVSVNQRNHNLRRRSWACPANSFEKQQLAIVMSAVLPVGEIDMQTATSRISAELGMRSRRSSLSRDVIEAEAMGAAPRISICDDLVTANPRARRSSICADTPKMYSSNGKGLPLFRAWGECAEGPSSSDDLMHGVELPRKGSLDFGDLESVRARLVEATQSWAASAEEAEEDRQLSEAIKTATAKLAADRLIRQQFQAAAERDAEKATAATALAAAAAAASAVSAAAAARADAAAAAAAAAAFSGERAAAAAFSGERAKRKKGRTSSPSPPRVPLGNCAAPSAAEKARLENEDTEKKLSMWVGLGGGGGGGAKGGEAGPEERRRKSYFTSRNHSFPLDLAGEKAACGTPPAERLAGGGGGGGKKNWLSRWFKSPSSKINDAPASPLAAINVF